jgi:flavodoxin I
LDIGIIVYSKSGHTLAVATRLKERLSAVGHNVALERIVTAGPAGPGTASVMLKTRPDVGRYDAVIFGCPVNGGLPAQPMRSYLEQLVSLRGKKVACLVTGFFQAAWGRNQTMAAVREICESKGADVCGSASVGWFVIRRHRDTVQAVDELAACLER